MSENLKDRVADRAAQATQGTVAVRPANGSLGAFVEQIKGEMARALPKHLNADRMARIALTCLRTTRNLDKCTKESFGGALMTCAQLGLEPGAGGEAYLLPFRSSYLSKKATREAGHDVDVYEVTLVIGYQGMIKLFWQSPLAKSIDAQAVYAGDDFDYAYGTEAFLRHKPALGERGQVIAYYAVATMTNGGSGFVVLSPNDVDRIRTRSKAKDDGPWQTDYDAMAKKTCIRQLFKLLPKSPELTRALIHDEGIRTDTSAEAIDLVPDYITGEIVEDAAASEQTPASPGSACAWCGAPGHHEDSCPVRMADQDGGQS